MNSALTIPADVMERALCTALAAADLESVQMLTAKEAAALLKLTPQGFRLIAKDHIDLGSKSTRWSLKDIKALVEKRRVKKP